MSRYRLNHLRVRTSPTSCGTATTRPRTAEDAPLEDLALLGQGTVALASRPSTPALRRSRERCHAIGLLRGDCEQHRAPDSLYCYYHDKVQQDLLETSANGAYPVMPLPAEGYVITAQQRRLTLADIDGELVAV